MEKSRDGHRTPNGHCDHGGKEGVFGSPRLNFFAEINDA